MTYEEYSKMPEAPSLEILYSLIIEKDPIIKICDCGNKKAFNNLTEQLNTLILKNKLLTVCKIMN